jgi:hypothetical protein
MKKIIAGAATAALLGLGFLSMSAGTASARVVCNSEGDCWHVDQSYRYHPDVHVEFHPDSWYFHNDWDHDQHRHWRGHHDGRGYWRNGAWVTF